MKSGLIVAIVVAMIAVSGVLMYFSYSNKEISLRNTATAQINVVSLSYDKMWKIINQKAQVSEQYKTAFKDIYSDLIEGRYGNEKGGSLMKFIQESNPNFDVSLYRDLSNSIEAERNSFFMEQAKVQDIVLQHNNLRQKAPGNWFLASRPAIEYKLITSKITQDVIAKGSDDDVNVFSK